MCVLPSSPNYNVLYGSNGVYNYANVNYNITCNNNVFDAVNNANNSLANNSLANNSLANNSLANNSLANNCYYSLSSNNTANDTNLLDANTATTISNKIHLSTRGFIIITLVVIILLIIIFAPFTSNNKKVYIFQ